MFLSEQNMYLSYIYKLKLIDQCKSLIYLIKSKGPKIGSWGTPHVMSKKSAF